MKSERKNKKQKEKNINFNTNNPPNYRHILLSKK